MARSTVSASADSPRELHIERIIPAPPKRVFAAWTSPEELRQWWGPQGVRCVHASVDLRVGGNYCIDNKLPGGAVLRIEGEFEIVRKPELLVYTWIVAAKSADIQRVTVRFIQCEAGTRLAIRHERIPTEELREDHEFGWLGCVDGLLAYLSA